MNMQQNPEQLAVSETPPDLSRARSQSKSRKSKISPALTGAIMGAIAGRFVPKLSPFSGAVLGIISNKMYQKHRNRTR